MGFELTPSGNLYGGWTAAHLNGSKAQYLNDNGEYVDICSLDGMSNGQMKTFDCDMRAKAVRLSRNDGNIIGLVVFRVYGV